MFSKRGWRAPAVALVLAGSTLLAGCGEDEAAPDRAAEPSASSSPSAGSAKDSPTPADAADCADVWQDGAKIPRGYPGCVEGGTFVEPDTRPCSSGQRMVRYGDHYYGVMGGTVHETARPLGEDRGYRTALRSCTA